MFRLPRILVMLLILIPILMVGIRGILFTDANDWQHLVDVVLPKYTPDSLTLLGTVPIFAGIIGGICAWLVQKYEFPGRQLITWLLIMPLALPSYLAAYAYVDYLQEFNWIRIRSMPCLIAIMACSLSPYCYLSTLAGLKSFPSSIYENARLLGASYLHTLNKIVMPMLRPSIAAGMIFVALEVINDFGTIEHFARDTFATGLYRIWFGYGSQNAAAALALLIAIIALGLTAIERSWRGRRSFAPTILPTQRPRKMLAKSTGIAAFVACFVPVAVGFLIPLMLLIGGTVEFAQYGNLGSEITRTLPALVRSIGVAAAIAFTTIGFCVIAIMISNRLGRLNIHPGEESILISGYALPGSVLAIGFLLAGANYVPITLLLFTALVAKFIAIPIQNVQANLGQIRPEIIMAARLSGLGPRKTISRVLIPLTLSSLTISWLIVFVDTIKELSISMLLRPFDFELLPIRIHNLASDERLDAASAGCVLLILATAIPLYFGVKKRLATL